MNFKKTLNTSYIISSIKKMLIMLYNIIITVIVNGNRMLEFHIINLEHFF